MGSQTLEILRQGVWASLTGGWFYDPHQNVFCNAVHLYLWLFLLCAPFVTYLYFPKTFTTWCAYCFTTAFTITMLKIVNMALHILYDKAQTMSDPNLKKPLKSLKESEGEDECGIEMQVLGADAPSGTSAEQPVNETSGANSMLSIDCQEHMTSTIDLKVDVHRKNSSESSDSVAIYPTNPTQNSSIPTFPCQSSNPRRSLKVKSKSEERPSKNPSITEEIIAQEGLIYTTKCYSSSNNEYYNVVTRKGAMKRKTKSKLERQISFDAVEAAAMDLSLARSQNSNTCCDIGIDNCNDNIRKTNNHKSTKLQRHKSSDSSNDDRQKRGRALFLNRHEQETRSDIRNQLQLLASDLYLENSYTKSDLDIENIECENSKLFLLQQSKTMRKDSNSTMSALQLSSACTNSSNMKRRRHSNTGCKPIMNSNNNNNHNSSSNVRRIKSAALEISCQQPSVSNLSPHPNSVETIAGQQIKNPQSAMLPPPSKCLVRNPHFNLCPSSFTNSGNVAAATTMEPVYPIAEQADEKSLYTGEIDSENENIEALDSNLASRHKRCSTTESESDMDRPRTQSTDSETDNNGSRSPLLNKINRHNSKCKNIPEEIKIKSALPLSIVDDVVSSKMMSSNENKKSDSGCPSSDCEQASASSKDMLLSRDKDGLIKLNKSWNGCTDGSSIKTTETQIETDGTDGCIEEDKRNFDTKTGKNGKNLGAIPKTVVNKRDDTNTNSKSHQGAIPKSTSRTSSSASSRSYSAESFSNEIYKPYKEQWLMVSGAGHNQHQPILPIFNYPRRTILESGLSSRLRCSSDSTKRNGDINNDNNNQRSKIEEISTSIDFRSNDLQNTGNTTLSIQGLINDQYSFENSITSEQRPATGAILNIGHVEFNDAVYCDYWRPCNLVVDKPVKPKRFYKYRLQFFGRREFKIAMDRLQLLALFDRDLHWFHVILAVALSFSVCFLGSIILQLGFYKDVFAFLFCVVIAGSQYSLLKSVQPDASSPIHGFNKTVAYSRPIYFCLFSSLLVFSHHLAKELESDTIWKAQQKELRIFGMPFSLESFLQSLTRITSIILLFFPVFFSLGLFPQINTFCMYLLEQIDMHIFGGSAACSLTASILSVLKSILAVSILYGPAFGGLTEEKGTQHISFSIFCALLIPIAYHLSRTASDFTHIWALIKSSLVSIPDDDEEEVTKTKTEASDTKTNKEETNSQQQNTESSEKIDDKKKLDNDDKTSSSAGNDATPTDSEPPDPLPKKLQHTVNSRLKNDILVASVLGVFVLGLHCSTIFTVLQPDLNTVLYSIAGVLGFMLHYVLPQMRKHLPWLCFSRPILRQQEFGKFEVSKAAKIMWFEIVYVCLCFLERNLLYPLIFISALTADSQLIVRKFGAPFGAAVVSICALKCVRSSYSDLANQYLILIFSVLLFKVDFRFASETFLVDYFVVSIIFKKSCDFLLKLQFIVTYIAPWQITWGSAFHAFAQPFSVPHSAMLFMQAAISAILSTPLNPFLGSAIFLTSYARPIKFWERDYNTRRIDHSNTRLSSQLERDLGADDNNLNSIFYEHLTRSLQHSLCGDLLLGRWGQVNQGDCFVLASDYLNCLVHIIELGNGICTFQMRGLEFRGTYCQQREVEAISEGVEENDGCCCCAPGHLPKMLSANAMFSTRWLAWQVVAAQYVLEGYSISENLATATLQVFEFRKVLITYYIKSIIYYVTRNNKLDEWLSSGPIQDALTHTLNRQFVDLDPIFNYNLDEDFDFRALGITRTSFCSVYLGWIQFCYAKKEASNKTSSKNNTDDKSNAGAQCCDKFSPTNATEHCHGGGDGDTKVNNNGNGSVKSRDKQQPPKTNHKEDENTDSSSNNNTITKDSSLVSLCLALGLLARRSLATASHSSLSGVEFFLHGLHALFKGDFRITSPRDEWVFADMELLHGVVAPAVKMALKLHQDHFSSPDEYLDPAILYDAISSHSKDLVISHEADPIWRSAVLRGAPNLLALRHVMEDGSDEYRIIRLTKRFLSFRVIKLNRECVRGLWAGQQQELIYLRNRNPERGSIQNAKQALRNIINSSCDQPIGYPIYVSPLTTSYAETNEQLCRIIGGSITLDTMRVMILDCWNHIRQRCREGCSSGSGGMECDTGNEVPGVYFSPAVANNTTATLSYGSQSLSGAGTRGSLASMNKPNSSTLLAGFLNRERDQERESIRERSSKRSLQNRADRERRATLPYTLSAISGSSRDFFVKDAMGSTNSGLRQNDGTDPCFSNKISSSSGNLGSNDMKTSTTDSCKANYDNSETSNNAERSDSANSTYPLIELSKKVIIVDGTEIYDCLDLGRRIDVVWPNEKMRSNGGRSSWKDWSPQEGMVGYVVHYWQPNHTDQRFRSNVNRTLYLVEIGDRYVPVGESGIREYNQIPDINLFRPAFSTINNNCKKLTIRDASTSSKDIPKSPPTTNNSDIDDHQNRCNRIDCNSFDNETQTEQVNINNDTDEDDDDGDGDDDDDSKTQKNDESPDCDSLESETKINITDDNINAANNTDCTIDMFCQGNDDDETQGINS